MAGRAHPKRTVNDEADGHARIPSSFTCPDCQGTLFLVSENDFTRFRCRIGHLYSPENMFEAQSDNVERLLWSARRALEEQAEYTSQMAGHIGKTSASLAREYHAISRSAQKKAEVLHKLIVDDPPQIASAHARGKRREALQGR